MAQPTGMQSTLPMYSNWIPLLAALVYLEVAPESRVSKGFWCGVQQPHLWLIADKLREDLFALLL